MEFLCTICKKKINEKDREEHMLTCVNAIRPDEYDNLIPCEFCNNLVNTEDYMDHVNNCYSQPNPMTFFDFLRNPPPNLQNINLPFPIQINNQGNSGNNNDNEDNSDTDDEENIVNNLNINLNGPNFNVVEITDDSINDIFNILSSLGQNNIIQPNVNNYSDLTNLAEQIGDVEVGLENKEKYLKKINIDNFKCPICFSESNTCIETICNHQLCEDCSNNWFVSNKKCPICNQELE